MPGGNVLDHRGTDRPIAVAADPSNYGLSERSYSALQAFARHLSGASLEERAAALREDLAAKSQTFGAATESFRRFVELVASLPERGLGAQWRDEFAATWEQLRAAGAPSDLPMRVLRAWVASSMAGLLDGRDTLSRLDVEILDALHGACLWAAGTLAANSLTAGAAPGIREIAPALPGSRDLPRLLDEALRAAQGAITGVIIGRLEWTRAVLAAEREALEALHDAAIARVREVARADDLLCRLGSSGFALILPRLRSEAQILLAANKVISVLEQPFTFHDGGFRVPARLGCAWAPEHGAAAEELVAHARLAMNEAGRRDERVELFDPSMVDRATREAELEREFLDALEQGLLSVAFQPQVDLRTGACEGAEVLLRWTDRAGEAIPPARIVEIAERLGMATQLTRWVVHAACRALSRLDGPNASLHLSVNMTARDVGDLEFPIMVSHALDLWRAEPGRLNFELTESAMLASQSEGAKVMQRLRELGVATSIDDFGTGFSSVVYLRELPLDELKIDQLFVRQMAVSAQDREIVRSLAQLAHSLGLSVVAEGIEDEETARLLADLGCERGQGYWISRPMGIEQFLEWLGARASGA